MQDTDVMLMEARVLEFHATCNMLTGYCNFLHDMNAGDYYALGCAPSIKVVFHNYLNNVFFIQSIPMNIVYHILYNSIPD